MVSWVGQKYVIVVIAVYGICQFAFISVFLFIWFSNLKQIAIVSSLFKNNPYMFGGLEDVLVPLDD